MLISVLTNTCPTYLLSHHQTSKYQKRFFQLTAENLVYGSCAKDLKDGGAKIVVFAMHKLQDLKKTDTLEFEVRSRFFATMPFAHLMRLSAELYV